MLIFLQHTAPYHRRGGFLPLKKNPTDAPILLSFLNAGRELGYHEIDPNLPDLIGKSYFRFSEKRIEDTNHL